MTYQEVNPTAWTYEKDGDFIEGELVSVQSDVGVNKSMLYSIRTEDGTVKSVWGASVLDSRMALISVGSKVKITFKGKAEAKKGKNSAKLFKVEVDVENKSIA